MIPMVTYLVIIPPGDLDNKTLNHILFFPLLLLVAIQILKRININTLFQGA